MVTDKYENILVTQRLMTSAVTYDCTTVENTTVNFFAAIRNEVILSSYFFVIEIQLTNNFSDHYDLLRTISNGYRLRAVEF